LVVGCGGIGRAIAQGLAEEGAEVAVADQDSARAEAVAADVRSIGRASLGLAIDVTDKRSVEAVAQELGRSGWGADILVNAVGIAARQPSEALSAEKLREVLDVNTVGTFLCCQVFGREMIRRAGGKIVNISSVRGRYGNRQGTADYCASKGAVDAMTRALAVEWARHGVLVNAVAPTVVETEFTKGLLAIPEAARELKERIPLGRWAQPEDIVGPVLFLASPLSDFVTGQILYVDGGLTAAA
jgi:NAD(P)-dependent dehydrogenase (short-subunit alcohol dehydrogenase family)